MYPKLSVGLPWWLNCKESSCQCRRRGFYLWVGKIHQRKKWQSSPILLLVEFHGQRNLVGYSPRGCKKSDTTEQLSMHAQLSANDSFLLGDCVLLLSNPGMEVKRWPAGLTRYIRILDLQDFLTDLCKPFPLAPGHKVGTGILMELGYSFSLRVLRSLKLTVYVKTLLKF